MRHRTRKQDNKPMATVTRTRPAESAAAAAQGPAQGPVKAAMPSAVSGAAAITVITVTGTSYYRGVLKETGTHLVRVPLSEREKSALHRERAKAYTAIRSAQETLALAQERYRRELKAQSDIINRVQKILEGGVKTERQSVTRLWDMDSMTVTTIGSGGVQIESRGITAAERAVFGPQREAERKAYLETGKAVKAARRAARKAAGAAASGEEISA